MIKKKTGGFIQVITFKTKKMWYYFLIYMVSKLEYTVLYENMFQAVQTELFMLPEHTWCLEFFLQACFKSQD